MPSIVPIVGREIKDELVKQSVELLRRTIAFVYSNENLGLETRTVSSNTTLSVRDAVVLANTGSGNVTLTLPLANSWSPTGETTQKSPFLILQKTSTSNTMTVSTAGSDVIVRGGTTSSSVTGNLILLYSDGVSSWYDIGANSTAMLVKTTYTPGSGTHTFNSATRYARITIVGGGGGGGAGNNHSTAGNRVGGGGGGAGEYVQVIVFPNIDGSSLSYTVGSKGTGGTGTSSTSAAGGNGTAGGLSFMGGYIALGGALGNGGDTAGNGGKGGAGGGLVGAGAAGNVSDGAAVAATGGGFASENVDQRIPGAGGGGAGRGVTATYRDGGIGGGVLGRLFASTVGAGDGSGAGGGGGGGCAFGAGGNGGARGVAGTAAALNGGGGGGGGSGSGSGTSPAGGNGADGIIIVEEFQ